MGPPEAKTQKHHIPERLVSIVKKWQKILLLVLAFAVAILGSSIVTMQLLTRGRTPAEDKAAEFFAAALQEYGWATVVGTKTCGKGNFQTAFTLSDGSMLNLSIGKYFTPNGRSLTDIGVTPDELVELSDEDAAKLLYGQLAHADDAQLQAAIRAIRQKIS